MNIALSKGSGTPRYQLYASWLKAAEADVSIVDLNGLSPTEAASEIESCSGLVLTGGEDVDPERYGQPEKRTLCGTIDAERDEMELVVAQRAIDLNIPVLGICRGLQLLNVLYGGTLIADIPNDGHLDHRPVRDDAGTYVSDRTHEILAEPGSLIRRICKHTEGVVTSAHHQAIERMATMFAPGALAHDGIVEAIEWGDSTMGGKSFLLAVQWHPERLPWDSAYSLPIAKHFVEEVKAFNVLFR